MVYILRNNKQYGPYDKQVLLSYVNEGQILLCDKVHIISTGETSTVRQFLRSNNLRYSIKHGGSLMCQLRKIGSELIIPKQTIVSRDWTKDKRLLLLALVGLTPSALMLMPMSGYVTFYMVSLYFAIVWGMFFYYFFRTPQVSLPITISVFFITQIFVFLVWNLLGIPAFNPFYHFIGSTFPLSLIGFVLGVGLSEEVAKAIPLLIIGNRAKEPLVPQTMVYYGLMSGIAFGVFEGVQYQTSVNIQLDYTSAFFMNIARLTSLPFLHAVWCGIAGYFIAFARLYPKYRLSLYLLSISIPAVLHGVYDTFCGSLLGMVIALPTTFMGVILLMTYLKQGVNCQSKLRS